MSFHMGLDLVQAMLFWECRSSLLSINLIARMRMQNQRTGWNQNIRKKPEILWIWKMKEKKRIVRDAEEKIRVTDSHSPLS